MLLVEGGKTSRIPKLCLHFASGQKARPATMRQGARTMSLVLVPPYPSCKHDVQISCASRQAPAFHASGSAVGLDSRGTAQETMATLSKKDVILALTPSIMVRLTSAITLGARSSRSHKHGKSSDHSGNTAATATTVGEGKSIETDPKSCKIVREGSELCLSIDPTNCRSPKL